MLSRRNSSSPFHDIQAPPLAPVFSYLAPSLHGVTCLAPVGIEFATLPGFCCVLTCERPLSAGPCDLPWALRLGTHSPRGVSRTSSHSTCLPRPPSAGPPGRFARGECPPRCRACLLCQERRAWCVQHVGTDVAVPARANSWPEQRLPRWSLRPALLPQRGRRRRRCGT